MKKSTHFSGIVKATVLSFGLMAVYSGSLHADIYVSRFGDGTSPLVNSPVAVATFIDKYSDAGTLITSYALPTTLSGANHALTMAANSTSVGHLSLSTNGQYLTIGGYDADAGTAAIRVNTTNRTIGRLTIADGTLDTTTSLSDAYPGGGGTNSGDIRNVVTTDGTKFWMSGNSFPTTGGQSGLQYATLGSTTSTRVSAGPVNMRNIGIFNGNIYATSATTTTSIPNSFIGLAKMTNGLPEPSTDDQSTADFSLLVGTAVSGSGNASPYDFWIRDDTTVYIADDRTAATGGGIQKWTFDGSSWGLAYTLNTGLTSGVRGLDATIVSGNPVFYASTAPSTSDGTVNNAIVTVTDTGASSAFTTLFSAPTNTTMRGVVFVAPPVGLAGDYNGDGKVNAADYVMWRNNPASFGGDPAGYNTWRANFGTGGSGAGVGAAAVPEAGSVALVLLGLAICGFKRRGR